MEEQKHKEAQNGSTHSATIEYIINNIYSFIYTALFKMSNYRVFYKEQVQEDKIIQVKTGYF